MGESVITIVAIFLAAVLMFVFPLVSVSERNDDISQLAVQSATSEFTDDIRTTGTITQAKYDAFLTTLSATGNSYDVELEAKILDENPGKKGTNLTQAYKIGENIYYSVYTSQILDALAANNGKYTLKEGDIINVTVKNTNRTIAELLRSFFYRVTGDTTYEIAASQSGMIMSTGK